jgi:hypothetical protein
VPEAGTLTGRLRREEGVEDASHAGARDPGPVVLDLDDDHGVVGVGPHDDRPVAVDGVDGVDGIVDEVAPDLVQLARVAPHAG